MDCIFDGMQPSNWYDMMKTWISTGNSLEACVIYNDLHKLGAYIVSIFRLLHSNGVLRGEDNARTAIGL